MLVQLCRSCFNASAALPLFSSDSMFVWREFCLLYQRRRRFPFHVKFLRRLSTFHHVCFKVKYFTIKIANCQLHFGSSKFLFPSNSKNCFFTNFSCLNICNEFPPNNVHLLSHDCFQTFVKPKSLSISCKLISFTHEITT